MSDVYDGSLGTFFDKKDLVNKLNHYMVTTDIELNYEFVEDRTRVVIITGVNDAERELPVWQHPVVFNDVNRTKTVAIDLRPYMKANLSDMISVREKLQDSYNGTLQLYRLVFTKLMLDNEMFWLKNVKGFLMEAMAAILSTTTTMILYDKTVADRTKIVSKLQLLSLVEMNVSDVTLSDLVLKLPKKDIQSLTTGDLKDFYAILKFKESSKELMLPSTTIGSLINNIKNTSDGSRTDGLTTDIYAQMLASGFFSLDSKNLSIAMLEDLPTFIAVITMVMTEGINSKSGFRKMLDNAKRDVKPKELSKFIIDTYKREIIEI